MLIKSKLREMPLHNQPIILRADLNVPLQDNNILDDFRLYAIKPTLDFLLKASARILLITHIGRPKEPDKKLSTKHLLSWFEKQQYSIAFAENIEIAQEKMRTENPGTIILLENIRFFEGEKNKDNAFAQQLASLGSVYVNDAFGSMDNDETSISLLPYQFSENARTIGFLVEKEISHLSFLLTCPRKGYVALLGGGKIKDKLPTIQGLLDKAEAIIVLPAIAFTFMKAMGLQTGKSLVDENYLDLCKKIIQDAQVKQTKLIFPKDLVVAKTNQSARPDSSLNSGLKVQLAVSAEASGEGWIEGYERFDKSFNELEIKKSDELASQDIGITIGTQTCLELNKIINQASVIFFNGLVGFEQYPQTLSGMHCIAKSIATSEGKKIIAGGDSVAYFRKENFAPSVDFCSTGGGSALTFISGKPLIGLEPFLSH